MEQLILKANNKELQIKVSFSKANQFQKEVCDSKKGETLLTLIPSKMMETDNVDFMYKMISFFQYGNEKMSDEEIVEFIDEYFEENEEEDFYSLYSKLLEQFDVSGIFKRGMGFKIATTIQKKMEEVQLNMDKEMNEQSTMETNQ